MRFILQSFGFMTFWENVNDVKRVVFRKKYSTFTFLAGVVKGDEGYP
jgi:hypothetical protein